MNYQNEILPKNAVKVGSTPSMTNETVVTGILKKHLAPKGKTGLLVVEEGHLQFLWEDNNTLLDADPDHPIVIFPERYHHVILDKPVRFRVEFYTINNPIKPSEKDGERPGEAFLK